MEFIIILIWIIVLVSKVVQKNKGTSDKGWNPGSGQRYGTNRTESTQRWSDRRDPAKNMQKWSERSARPEASWRNTAEVTKADISFRGLREGEDELAYLIRRNTAYERLLEKRLESRSLH